MESGNINPELLKRSNRLSKNPEEYENENDRKRKIGLAIAQDISIRKYKAILWKAVKDILEITGYDIAAVEQELISNRKDDHMAKPPRGVVEC